MDNKIEITFNSGRLVLSFTIFLFFFALGLLFLIKADSLATIWIFNSIVIQAAGILSVMCSVFFMFLFFKIAFRKVAIVLDSEGIIDTSNALSAAGRIKWEQVIAISNMGNAVHVFIKEPESFIEEKETFLNRWSLKRNYSSYGTPVVIPLFALNSYVDTLERQLRERWELYKQTNPDNLR